MSEIISVLQKEWGVIGGAPLDFCFAVAVMAGVIWWFVGWINKATVSGKNATIEVLGARIAHLNERITAAASEGADKKSPLPADTQSIGKSEPTRVEFISLYEAATQLVEGRFGKYDAVARANGSPLTWWSYWMWERKADFYGRFVPARDLTPFTMANRYQFKVVGAMIIAGSDQERWEELSIIASELPRFLREAKQAAAAVESLHELFLHGRSTATSIYLAAQCLPPSKH